MRIHRFFTFLAVCVLLTQAAFSATYYTSTSLGQDTNAGTLAAPFKTIAKGTSVMVSGDTLLMYALDTFTEQLTVPCESCTFSRYGSTTKQPTITGGAYGVFLGNHSSVTVTYLYVTHVTGSAVAAICSKATMPSNGTFDHLIVDHYGYSGLTVLNCNYATMPPITGWIITNNYVGVSDAAVGLDYNKAGIQLGGLSGAVVSNNNVQTVTEMGIQDRAYYSAPCNSNVIEKNQATNNEGGISGICTGDYIGYNHVYTARGFGVQPGPNGRVQANIIENLSMGTGGTLYNGIDGKGATGVTYINNTVTNVAGCSITVEGIATGTSILGGTYNSTAGGQCALYSTASAGAITLSGVTWVTAPSVAKPFGYLMTGPGDSAHKYSLVDFLVMFP